MQAYYEIETQILPDHRLDLQLPESIPAGLAKVAVIYELPQAQENQQAKMSAFLQNLPELTDGSGLSRAAICDQLQRERQNWD